MSDTDEEIIENLDMLLNLELLEESSDDLEVVENLEETPPQEEGEEQ